MPTHETRRTPPRGSLSILMALVYAVQGAWWPILTTYLADGGIGARMSGLIFATMAIAASLSPLSFGRLADRVWDAKYCLACIYLVGAAGLFYLAAAGPTGAWTWFWLLLAYWLVTAPGYALANAVVLRNLDVPHREFGKVRLWGTVGWMVVGWLVSLAFRAAGGGHSGIGARAGFWVAAVLSVIVSVFCLSLPKSPPVRTQRSRGFGPPADLVRLIAAPNVAGYLVIALLSSMTTPFLYQLVPLDLASKGLARSAIPSLLTLVQVPEILGLAWMPWLISRFGYRGVLAIGLGSWALRYGSLAIDPPLWTAIAGIPLHGIGTACVTVGGQMFLDSRAPADARASAQSFNYMITSGYGCLLGSLCAGVLREASGGSLHWVFAIPFVINAVCVVVLAGFRRRSTGDRGGGTLAGRAGRAVSGGMPATSGEVAARPTR